MQSVRMLDMLPISKEQTEFKESLLLTPQYSLGTRGKTRDRKLEPFARSVKAVLSG